MSKIRLLILLLINLIFISCVNNQKDNKTRFSLAYISGGYDGLVLTHKLQEYLNNFGILDNNSIFQIQASVSHSSNLFITNIDNTSDREKISSRVDIKIFNTKRECYTYFHTNHVSQFYVLAAGDRFISNKTAVEEIRIENIDYLLKVFINELNDNILVCKDE